MEFVEHSMTQVRNCLQTLIVKVAMLALSDSAAMSYSIDSKRVCSQ